MRQAYKLLLGIFSAAIFLFCQGTFSATQAGSDPKLVEAAKGEGGVSYYTTMTLSQSKKVADKFQAKYPFIKWICSEAAATSCSIEFRMRLGAAFMPGMSHHREAIQSWR